MISRYLLRIIAVSLLLAGMFCTTRSFASGVQTPGRADSQSASPGIAPATAAAPAAPKDQGWPRSYSNGTATLVVYQPQIDDWSEFKKLTGRSAIALTTKPGAQPVYGAFRFQTETVLDADNRNVICRNIQISDVRFSSSGNGPAPEQLAELTQQLFPKTPVVVSMARVLATVDAQKVHIQPREAQVSLAPPPIFVRQQAAALVITDGGPIAVDIENTSLQHIVNTNWDLFFDKSGKAYYLRYEKSWLKAPDLKGAYRPVSSLPADFASLPADEQYKELRATFTRPLPQPAAVPLVLVSDKPAELIVIKGKPSLRPIAGTGLMWVQNTESDLFFDPADHNYYFLASGRWFRTANLTQEGTWVAATTQLPEDFKKIPSNFARAHVLASVPGTREAEEAVIFNSMPRSAEVSRADVKAQVEYVGTPAFTPISETGVSYASNTPNDVFQVGDRYYLCLEAAWFVSSTPNGPWQLADSVPQAIYSIPPDSPKYNVTYVQVYDSTPTSVVYGYTPGYLGVYVAAGLALWGTGYYYPPYVGVGFHGYPAYWGSGCYTYGASAWYNPATGVYARGGAVYGPYGGYGRAAAYNPATGAYAWGAAAYSGTGAAAAGARYNPSTGRWSAGYQASNPYASWGRSATTNGSNWAQAGHYTNSRGTVAGAETSAGGKAVATSTARGNAAVGKTAGGDVYAGADGNVYKRSSSGEWYKNDNGSWNSVSKPATTSTEQSMRNQAANRPATAESQQSGTNQAALSGRGSGLQGGSAQAPSSLSSEAAARDRGNWNTQRADTASRASSRSGGGGFQSRPSGGGFGGGGGRMGGGGGRRR